MGGTLPIATDRFKAKVKEITDGILKDNGVNWGTIKRDRDKYNSLNLGVGGTILRAMRKPCAVYKDASEGSYFKLARALKMHHGINLPLKFNDKGQLDWVED